MQTSLKSDILNLSSKLLRNKKMFISVVLLQTHRVCLKTWWWILRCKYQVWCTPKCNFKGWWMLLRITGSKWDYHRCREYTILWALILLNNRTIKTLSQIWTKNMPIISKMLTLLSKIDRTLKNYQILKKRKS